MFSDMLMHPVHRLCNVANDGSHVDVGEQSIIGGHKDETLVNKDLWLELNT